MPDQSVKYTCCPYNCWPVNCGLAVTVKDDRIIRIQGNPDHDLSRGRLCVKGQSSGEVHSNPHRLFHPLERAGERGKGKWRKISWDRALDRISEKLRKNIDSGNPEKNVIYHSHGNIVQRINWKILTPRFANKIGATLWDGNFPCWYDVGLAQELTGYYGLHDPVIMGEHSKAVVNWAQDFCASQANITPYILKVRDRGGEVVTIDPRVTQSAALSTLHLRPRLGSDVWLANAVAHLLIKNGACDDEFLSQHCHGFGAYKKFIQDFDPKKAARECEISLFQIEKLASIFARYKPLCINLTRGALGKHSNGVQMVRAILCLIPLSGNLGKKGGGAIWGETIEWNLNLCAESKRPGVENNFKAIDAALENREVDQFMVVGGNPLSQWPNLNRLKKQLEHVDQIVVYDLFLNRTAQEVGDLVLPATSWLEELGLRTSLTRIYLMDKMAQPLGQCKEASWWMDQLAKRLGIPDYFPWDNKEQCLNECLRSEACSGAVVKTLRKNPGGIKAHIPETPFGDYKCSSPSGRFEFYSQKAEALGISPLPIHHPPVEGPEKTPELYQKYPLRLISSRRNTHFHSFHNSHSVIPTLKALEPGPVLHMHPQDAFDRRIQDQDWVRVFNDRGAGWVRVEITTEVSPGHISLNDCWPELNRLTSAHCPVDPKITKELKVGGQPSYQNVLAEVEKP